MAKLLQIVMALLLVVAVIVLINQATGFLNAFQQVGSVLK